MPAFTVCGLCGQKVAFNFGDDQDNPPFRWMDAANEVLEQTYRGVGEQANTASEARDTSQRMWIQAYKPPVKPGTRAMSTTKGKEEQATKQATRRSKAEPAAGQEGNDDEEEDLNHGLTIPLLPPDSVSGFWQQSNMD